MDSTAFSLAISQMRHVAHAGDVGHVILLRSALEEDADLVLSCDDVREDLDGEDLFPRNNLNGLSGDIVGNEDVDELLMHPMRGHCTTEGTKQT